MAQTQPQQNPGDDIWQITASGAAAVATVTKAAGAAGVQHVCRRIMVSLAAGATPSVALLFVLRDGATTAGTILAQLSLACIANGQAVYDSGPGDLAIVGTAATAMCIETTAAGAATTIATVTAWGYDIG